MGAGDVMPDIERKTRWTLTVCKVCGQESPYQCEHVQAADRASESAWMALEVVPAAQLEGVVGDWRREAERACNDGMDEWPDGSPCVCIRGTTGCALTHAPGGGTRCLRTRLG
jgi:hypothetical protein